MPEYTEQDIIKGCKKNDRLFQEHLYKKYYSRFLKVCARYAKNMQDAEQLLQDGFIKIFKHIGNYSFKGSFEGWMQKIMVNTCLDYLKSKYLKDANQLELNSDFSSNNSFTDHCNVLDQMALKDLLALIQTLPPMSKTVFNLFIFEGYAHREIAKILEISEGTSQWHVNNARKNLQKKILNSKVKAEEAIKKD